MDLVLGTKVLVNLPLETYSSERKYGPPNTHTHVCMPVSVYMCDFTAF